jgi:hypothetical protein
MVQLKVLSGSKAGTVWVARRFPVRIGRGAGADLQLEEDGVWDQHARLDFIPAQGIVLSTHRDALAAVNARPVQRAVLRNGDELEIGCLKLRFWLSEIQQRGLRFREGVTWAAIAAITIGQVALIYWMLR